MNSNSLQFQIELFNNLQCLCLHCFLPEQPLYFIFNGFTAIIFEMNPNYICCLPFFYKQLLSAAIASLLFICYIHFLHLKSSNANSFFIKKRACQLVMSTCPPKKYSFCPAHDGSISDLKILFYPKLTLAVDISTRNPLNIGILGFRRSAFPVNLMSTETSTSCAIFSDQPGNQSNGVFVPSGTFKNSVPVDAAKLTDPGIRSQPFCVP